MRRVLVSAAGVLALVAAGLLALVADDVRDWPERFRAGDLSFRAASVAPDPWHAPDRRLHLPARLLGVDDDLALRRALQLVRRSHDVDSPNADAWALLRLQGQAESALAAVERSEPDPARRSLAANLLGLLLYEDSLTARTSGQEFRARSVEAFRRAIRLDPENADAKFNLELLFVQLPPRAERRRGGRGGTQDPQQGASGAGVSPTGEGY
jgi:tetratricopeptide (TPR) repeat protein